MKILLAALVVGPFILAGVAQAGVTQFNPLRASASTIYLAASENPADRKIYVQTKDGRMAQWRSTIDDFEARTQAKATAADQAASREIQGAWNHVERASSALDGAGRRWLGQRQGGLRASVPGFGGDMGQDRTVKELNRLPLDSVPAPRRRRRAGVDANDQFGSCL